MYDDYRKCLKCGNGLPENTESVKYWHVRLTQTDCVASKVCIYCTNRGKVTKECCKCGTVYPATSWYFGKDKRGKLGLLGRCKNCMIAKRLEKYKAKT